MQNALVAFALMLSLTGCKTPAARGDGARLLDDDGAQSDPATAALDLEAKAPHLSNAKLDAQSCSPASRPQAPPTARSSLR